MKQEVKTPELVKCSCGAMPEVMPAITGHMHYDKHYMIQCPRCKKHWPRNAASIHRAKCKWNHHQKQTPTTEVSGPAKDQTT